ncbi:hypothetical protein C5E11_03985 [Clavibacter michiganensis]|nr:DEAD/DEAH box helicase [Clavibacter michiganensis]PPF64558.1 hypothetical protein C5E11_03985 [Clavibacter michiganensis]
MSHTYGTYQYRPPKIGEVRDRGSWVLTLEPAVRARAKRVFGRLKPSRQSNLVIGDTIEVARDIVWFMERFPLEPADHLSEQWLTQGSEEHIRQEEVIGQIQAGTYQRTSISRPPLKTPRDYQLSAIDLLRARGRLMLTDAVGLGKTFTGLLSVSYDDAFPALIVPPTHLPPRWVEELRDAFPWLTFEVAKTGKPSVRAKTGNLADVTIVSYSKLVGWAPAMQNQVQTVIFDEVQELRHGADATEKGAAAGMVADNASYVLGLTATPIHNYGGEVWNIYDIIAPGSLGTKDEFSREWGGAAMSNGRMMVKDPAALGNYLRQQGLMMGRTREDVGRELPQTIKVSRLVDSYTEALDQIDGNVKALAQMILDDSSTHQKKFTAQGQIDMLLRQATGVDKAPFVAEFCRLLLEAEDKIVLWGWHRDVYDIWLDKLSDFHPRLYTGSESPKQKADAIAAFMKPMSTTPIDPDAEQLVDEDQPVAEPDDCRVLIMSLRSGAGVDGLQKHARVGVFGELDWSPTVHEQAIGRLARDGIEDPPVIYFLNSAQGSDPVILEKLQIKRQQQEPMLSKDGQMFAPAAQDPHRARRLAERILGLTPSPEEQESVA